MELAATAALFNARSGRSAGCNLLYLHGNARLCIRLVGPVELAMHLRKAFTRGAAAAIAAAAHLCHVRLGVELVLRAGAGGAPCLVVYAAGDDIAVPASATSGARGYKQRALNKRRGGSDRTARSAKNNRFQKTCGRCATCPAAFPPRLLRQRGHPQTWSSRRSEARLADAGLVLRCHAT